AEDAIRDRNVTGVQTCALPILLTEQNMTMMGIYSFVRLFVKLLIIPICNLMLFQKLQKKKDMKWKKKLPLWISWKKMMKWTEKMPITSRLTIMVVHQL